MEKLVINIKCDCADHFHHHALTVFSFVFFFFFFNEFWVTPIKTSGGILFGGKWKGFSLGGKKPHLTPSDRTRTQTDVLDLHRRSSLFKNYWHTKHIAHQPTKQSLKKKKLTQQSTWDVTTLSSPNLSLKKPSPWCFSVKSVSSVFIF